MALTIIDLKCRLLLLLFISNFNFTLILCDFGSIIGSDVSTPTDNANRNRLYLNTARPAPCNGTIRVFGYCYYGNDNNNERTYQVLVSIYRPMAGNDYINITNTVPIIKRTPLSEVPLADALLPGFNCDSVELEESVQVIEEDVIGACVVDNSLLERLDVVSRNNNNGYRMPYDDANNCESLQRIIGNNLQRTGDGRILHIFAEIFPDAPVTMTTTTTMTMGTTPLSQDFLITAAGSVIAGIVVGAVIIIVTLVSIFVCARQRKQKRLSRKINPWLPQRSHRISSSNLVSDHYELGDDEAHAVRLSQNLACSYERPECTTFTSNERHDSILISQVPQPSTRGQRNNHYETGSQYTPPRTEYHFYFTLEGPDYPYDELIEKNKTQNLYVNVREFNEPAREEEDLYAQIKSCGIRNISRSSIQITGHLGSGQFGSVKEGTWSTESCQAVRVALKTLNQDSTQENKVKFLQEAAIMAQFRHPNVVLLYGIVSKEEPITLVVQLVEKGDLRNYLLSIRPNPGENPSPNLASLLLSFSQHVALGMQYLSGKGFVHRDLAARNILVSKDNLCKIADFGLSRDLANEKYYISKGGIIPIKWTAPEAIEEKKYSTASDVWSYGCVLYEIWSLGYKPYEQISNFEAIRFFQKGKRLSPPPGCPKTIYDLMIQCWNPARSKRPIFRRIHLNLLENEEDVLSIPQEALDTHQLAGVLGSPLKAGERMYEDLQTRYIKVEYYAII